jgi:thioredoxin-like negative regulator of GroEL
MARGQYAEAVDAIRTGIKSVPNWPEQKFRASDLYLANPKRLASDVADLKAAMAAAPTDSTLSFLYAHHLWFSGEKEKATELFAKLKDKVKEKELVEPFVK